jgi:flagellar protein FlgJ
MTDPIATAVPPALATATADQRSKIHGAAQKFEASFLSLMMQQMMQGVGGADATFGGGQGEDMFKSFMADAIAKQVSQKGGIGMADTVSREMLKVQGLQ